ncbi:hypothetical protein FOL47_002461 [Perkinsus chesapeaki]|uniref:2-amino-3-carboxymuconate-6-semialdehyde decarboxylase n=1 Tax=Perkinsus chesapeaki TaxID=330153 RepID=A0A7J6MDU4_PERCH|nr:hypothetical protein FOL47_002461 [Perkinsus chesapeaki]
MGGSIVTSKNILVLDIGGVGWRWEDDEEEEVADNNDEVSINGCGGGKIDIHTHILPQDWPSIEGFDLRIVDLPKDDDIGRKAGFIKRMEWVNTTNASSSVPPGEGTLPLQHPEEAAKEMTRAVIEKGMRGFQIGSHINSWTNSSSHSSNNNNGGGGCIDNIMLNDKRLLPIWETAKSLNVGIFIHPWDMEWCWQGYWLPWLVGMPTEVSLAMCSIMLGGVIDKIPGLKVMFAHGGGSIPGTLGRIEWGWRCRPDLVAKDSKVNPREAVKKLYVDSICHDPRMLNIIVDMFGANRVALGSDYPFPLGEVPSVAPETGEILTAYPGQLIEDNEYLDDKVKSQLLNGTAIEFLGINRCDYDIPPY